MTHVLISAGRLELGGVRTHLAVLCRVLISAGYRVTIAGTGCQWPPDEVQEIAELGVQFVIAAPGGFGRRVRTLVAFWANLPRGVTVIYWIGTGRSHSYIKQLYPGVPVVYHELVGPPGPESLSADHARKADHVVANSRLIAQQLAGYAPKAQIRVIPFLTTAADPPPPVARRPPAGERVLRIVYLGRLVKQKRPDRLAMEWRRLTSGPPIGPARLEIFGYDPSGVVRASIESVIQEWGHGATVELHGEYKPGDLPAILSDKDVLVLPSEWEGLPLVLVEAMQLGVPFVATAAGGTAEFGDSNPDVAVTGADWQEFESGLATLCRRVRTEGMEPRRLYDWATARYGFDVVSGRWVAAFADPPAFFNSVQEGQCDTRKAE